MKDDWFKNGWPKVYNPNKGLFVNSHSANKSRIGLSREVHGLTGTKEYIAWKDMRKRCRFGPSHKFYQHYAGRGISVCPRWDASFIAFYLDMGKAPTPMHSLDRINNDGDYEPGNCRWATKSEQRRNQRPRRATS
jgi:hypothetical protein